MNRLCQAVLPLGLVLVAGCYEMHGVGGADSGERPDAGRPPSPDATTLPWDGGPWLPDVGAPSCPLVRADATCLDSFFIETGRSFELPFQFDGCGCCIETSCDVSVDPSTRTIRAFTHLCPDPCDCDACVVPRGTCLVPALAETDVGQWTVEMNGTAAFVIGVAEPEPGLVPGPAGCATYAEVDECGGAVPDFTTGPIRGDICVEHGTFEERDLLRMRSSCWGCGQLDSACNTVVTERLTTDLPPGGDIVLLAREYATACDVDCPAVCVEHVRECELPPLVEGNFYQVFVDGERVHTFAAGEPTTPCVAP